MICKLLVDLLRVSRKLTKRKDQGLISGYITGMLTKQESETRSANAKPTVLPTEPLGTQATEDQVPRAVAPSWTDCLVTWGCLWSPALSHHFHWIDSPDISNLMTWLQWVCTMCRHYSKYMAGISEANRLTSLISSYQRLFHHHLSVLEMELSIWAPISFLKPSSMVKGRGIDANGHTLKPGFATDWLCVRLKSNFSEPHFSHL